MKTATNAVGAGIAFIGICVLIAGMFLLNALLFKWGWNDGITNIVKACGGHAGNISFGTAVLSVIFVNTLRQVQNYSQNNKK